VRGGGQRQSRYRRGEDLTGNARDVGAYFQDRLRETFADHGIVGEVRGVGLLAALEFATGPERRDPFEADLKVAPRVAAAMLEEGVIARALPHGDILGFAPPLVITAEEIDIVVSAARKAADKVAGAL
jgi:L-2,4-diaminobutyrate transaminase